MDVLLDVNIVVDICQPRPEFIVDALKVLSRCRTEGSRIWLYAGSVQTLEYSLLRGIMADANAAGRSLSVSQAHHRARLLLRAFCEDKHWLAALAGEGDVFDAADPEDEQLAAGSGSVQARRDRPDHPGRGVAGPQRRPRALPAAVLSAAGGGPQRRFYRP